MCVFFCCCLKFLLLLISNLLNKERNKQTNKVKMKIKEVWSRLNYLALIWNQSYNFTGREAPNYGRTRKETCGKDFFFFFKLLLKKNKWIFNDSQKRCIYLHTWLWRHKIQFNKKINKVLFFNLGVFLNFFSTPEYQVVIRRSNLDHASIFFIHPRHLP